MECLCVIAMIVNNDIFWYKNVTFAFVHIERDPCGKNDPESQSFLTNIGMYICGFALLSYSNSNNFKCKC